MPSILSRCFQPKSHCNHSKHATNARSMQAPRGVCDDPAIDIVLMDKEIRRDDLTSILYTNLQSDAFQQAFRSPEVDTWSMAETSTWGTFQPPNTYIFKAVLKKTSETIGYGGFRYMTSDEQKDFLEHEAGWLEQRKKSGDRGIDALKAWCDSRERLSSQYINMPNYIIWTDLEVLPQYDGMNIDTQLLTWAFSNFDLDQNHIYCEATIDELPLFRSYGWVEVGTVDIDLSEIKGKGRGYGLHRTYGLLRSPASGDM